MRTFKFHESPAEVCAATQDESEWTRRELALIAMIENMNADIETRKAAYLLAVGRDLHGRHKEMEPAERVFEADEMLKEIRYYHGINSLTL
jgi:glycine/serine hydroxymethyltransferase